ncbi:hypothetical protein [Microbacterium sp. YY-01]|uniref:hypothetical protein n=1 Tax=Microbacterium sp. YY-01 TaxID=3421634 RepID=UPI003D1683E6
MEPRFTPAEVELLLASRRAEQVPRGAHGFTIAEATDPKNQYAFKVTSVVDYAERAKHWAIKEHEERFGENSGSEYRLWRTELATPTVL